MDETANEVCELSPGQLAIIAKLADLHAELTCCLREAQRIHLDIDPKDTEEDDKPNRLLPL